jgi:phosphoribosyl 1,2-cyclic phosphodiesterase
MLQVRFWGVRGSIPCPGHDTVIYGGNTACIEIRADDRLIIIDLGSGARPLGNWLIDNDLKKNGKIKADIFITHTHWDHIMGFPMFSPIYNEKVEFNIRGPISSISENLKDIFETLFSHNFWPVRLDGLSAKIEYNQINQTSLDLGGDLVVTSNILNHTVICLGYRIDYKGKSIGIVYDHESLKMESNKTTNENEKLFNFLKDVDILIHDSQYTSEEYPYHIGWGHSTLDNAVQTADAVKAKKLVFFHHDPSRTDTQLEQLEKNYMNNPITAIMAREGMILQV